MSLACISSAFHKEVQIKGTHVVIYVQNSNAGSGTGSMPGRHEDSSLAVHPVPSENIPGRPLVVVLGPGLQQRQTKNVLIDTGARLDSGGNSFVSLADSDPNFAVTEQGIVPTGTVTFQEGEISTTTTIAISLSVSVDPQIGLNFIAVVLINGVWIFIFSVTLERALRRASFEPHWPCCSGQNSKPQRCRPAFGGTTRGFLDSSYRFPDGCP